MMSESSKSAVRQKLRQTLTNLPEADRRAKSSAACALLAHSAEFTVARVVMLYLPMPAELDTTPLIIRAWQAGKTVVVPKVSWDQRRMLPVEISSLSTDSMTTTGPGVREPINGNPVPVRDLDLVIVPGLGFTAAGFRIGRGMGFYDRFLAQEDFLGVSCGLAYEEQIVEDLPILDHDIPLGMLATDQGIRRFASHCIEK